MSGRADTAFAGHPVNNSYFVAKMHDDGQLVWLKQFNMFPAFTIDGNGSVYIAVTYYSSSTLPFDNLPLSSTNSLVLGKLSAAGNAQWVKQYPMSDIGSSRVNLQVSPDGKELMMAAYHSKSLNIDGTPLTLSTYDTWGGFVGRFSPIDGTKKKIVSVGYYANSGFKLASARWVGNDKIVVTGFNNSSQMGLQVGSTQLSAGYHVNGFFIYTCLMDTTGTPAWLKVIKGALPTNGYNYTDVNALEVAGNRIYIGGSVSTNSTIEGSNLNTTYGLSSSFVAGFDLAGNVTGYTNGGFTNSENNIQFMVFTPQQKLFVSGTHRDWTSGGTASFGGQPVTRNGLYQMFYGRLTAPGIFTAVPTLGDEMSTKLYPNPARRHLFVTLQPQRGARLQLEIINAVGQPLRSFDGGRPLGSFSRHIDISGLPPGTYYLRSTSGTARSTRPFIILQ